MKKLVIITLCLTVITYFSNINKKEIIIPKEAIRFRVIANSNSDYDQTEKKKIAKELSEDVVSVLKDTKNINQARNIIQSNLSSFEEIVKTQTEKDKYKEKISINYGQNYFPEKEYKGIKYKEGEYESLVVTLGSGKGENFWCILFPPLCLLEADETKTDEIEYKSFIKELIDKYF